MFTTILFLVVLSILVFVHELGHFLLAKWAKVRVDEFAIGFPPTIFSYKPKNSETKYALNLIPFGGYVKIYGENPMDVKDVASDGSVVASAPGSYKGLSITKIPKYKQVMILLAGVAFNIIFAYLLFVAGMTIGMPTGYDASLAKYFSNRRIAITEVLPSSPAEKAGIKAGDEILSIKGIKDDELASKEFTKEFFQNIVSQSSGPVSLSLKRAGTLVALSVTPGTDVIPAGSPGFANKKAIGVGIADIGTLKLPFYKAIYYGGVSTVSMTADICTRLASLIYDAVRGLGSTAHLSGPVGIAKMVGQASESGFVYLLLFTAIISINLAVLNTLPFPALDGGRVLFVIIEFFKRSPIRPSVVQWFNLAGFGILILLMILITVKDIVGLF